MSVRRLLLEALVCTIQSITIGILLENPATLNHITALSAWCTAKCYIESDISLSPSSSTYSLPRSLSSGDSVLEATSLS